ncbi:MAG: hypothetical protein AAGA62_11660, partial [Bacteroidota bacterium]
GGHIYFYEQKTSGRSFLILDEERLLAERYLPFLDHYEMDVAGGDLLVKYQERFRQYWANARRYESVAKGEYAAAEQSRFAESPVRIQFVVRPDRVDIAEPFELNWSVEGTTNIVINQGIGAVKRHGRKVLRAEKDVTFLLTAQSRSGQFTVSATVMVNPAAKITYRLTTFEPGSGQEVLVAPITALPHYFSVVKGQVLRLYWRVFNADEVRHSELGIVADEGMQDFMVKALTSFTLSARQNDKTVQQTIVLNVLDLAQVEGWLDQVRKQHPAPPTPPVDLLAPESHITDQLLPTPPTIDPPMIPTSLWQRLGQLLTGKNENHGD